MSAKVLLKAIGLNTQPNQLDLPEGSLTVASNVIIKRDNVIESRRGYRLYGTSMGTSTDYAKQMTVYKNRIIRHYADKLQFDTTVENDDGQSIFSTFDGSYLEPRLGRRMRFIEANGNLYFTSNDGIKKISVSSPDQFSTASGFITNAGGVKAVDLTTTLKVQQGDQSSWFNQDSKVAYRVVWGIIDANNNLILGTPSQRSIVSNPMISLVLQDFAVTLGALDDVSNNSTFPSLISDGNYVDTLLLPMNASAQDLQTNLIALAAKIDNDLLYADDVLGAPLQLAPGSTTIAGTVATITFATGNPQDYFVSGSKIYLAGFSPTTGTLDGPQIISSVTATTITFETSATGPVTTSSPTINSNEFRDILPLPTVPSVPPTHDDILSSQTYLLKIMLGLQALPNTGTPPSISASSQTQFVADLDITTTATVILDITIPQGITTDYFFQVYRSAQVSAVGSTSINDISPNDELQLVYEAFVTSDDISAAHITFEDQTPDAFRGANLYTNATTGEGILQANDIPPFALDINRFKNVIFYANTKTRNRLSLSLLGVTNMIADYNDGTTPKILISNEVLNNTYSFVTGLAEISEITTNAGSTLNSSGDGNYFLINTANDRIEYYVWYQIGTSTDPLIANKIGLEVEALTTDTANDIAFKTASVIARQIESFTVSVLNDVVTVTNFEVGQTTDTDDGDTGFAFVTTQDGRGEDVSTLQVLLSTAVSPAQAVDETARSFVRIINENTNESVYAFYLSGEGDVPGKIFLESRALSNPAFYLVANNSNTGLSWNPDLSPEAQITSITAAPDAVITTSTPHNMINLDQVLIVASDSTPSVDGLFTITYISPTSFSIPVTTTIPGTEGAIHRVTTAVVSSDDAQANRIYYSKFLQPEAVPITNFLDVGAKDKEILRIMPLRDSLFVFKEDGLFRISGEQAPWNLALFDSSCDVIAVDSVDISNNLIYCWTTQGIVSVSESGVNIVSRAIDIDILKLSTSGYTNFETATWGMGYEADNSYTVYTVDRVSDVLATIGYRYSTLTNSWTTFDKSCTSGVVNPVDGKQYLGAGDTNFIEQERKDFTRYDYADRELAAQLIFGDYFDTKLKLAGVAGITAGDVVVQTQYVTIYEYNSLLKKLDFDPTLGPHDYFSTLESFGGDNLRNKVDALIDKVANDPTRLAQSGATSAATYLAYQSIVTLGTITNISADNPTVVTSTGHGLQTGRLISISGSDSTPSIDGKFQVTVLTANTFTVPVNVKVPGTTGTFSVNNDDFLDVQASYNGLIMTMNNDTGVAFSNYKTITRQTPQEAVILAVSSVEKTITLNFKLDYVVGPLVIFKSIATDVTWAPQTMGDPLGLKHLREMTLMFNNKAFTNATMSFATDLLPRPIDVPFNGDGNGIFGYTGIGVGMPDDRTDYVPGFGGGLFGGGSNSAPFRTTIPRDCQRCRYIVCQFNHMVAREQYAIFGLSLIGEISTSTRAYR